MEKKTVLFLYIFTSCSFYQTYFVLFKPNAVLTKQDAEHWPFLLYQIVENLCASLTSTIGWTHSYSNSRSHSTVGAVIQSWCWCWGFGMLMESWESLHTLPAVYHFPTSGEQRWAACQPHKRNYLYFRDNVKEPLSFFPLSMTYVSKFFKAYRVTDCVLSADIIWELKTQV